LILNLNSAQQAVADAVQGDWVCIAGPGSGKTATLIQRYLGMITKYGIQPADILNLTFTNSAACEMVERVGLLDAKKVFRTFHSFALDLLQRERQHVKIPLCDTIIPVYGEDFKLMKELVNIYPAITSFRALKDKLSEWKASNISPERAIEEGYYRGTEFFYAQAYKDYERRCREEGWLDFDSLMKETVKLLEENNEVRTRNQRKYISVDECQDTDVIQFQLLKLIYGGNIFVVGDENQLIYEWRSAQAGNLSNFARTFPGAKTLYLGQNYRSTKALVAFFKRILPVDNGLASYMTSERPEGEPPTFTQFRDEFEEHAVVIDGIIDYPNSAVLARTNRQLQSFQKRCMAIGLKSKILGRKNVWEENEVRHLIDLAKKYEHDYLPAHQVLTKLISDHNLAYTYRNSGNPNEKDPIENLNDVVKMSAKKGSLREFLAWFRKLIYGAKSDKKPCLTLSTVHQAKGREWKHVYVIGCSQGIMPHKDGELLEEHRIFFVACSRAADTLDISFSGSRSQFLNEFIDQIEIYEDEREQDVT